MRTISSTHVGGYRPSSHLIRLRLRLRQYRQNDREIRCESVNDEKDPIRIEGAGSISKNSHKSLEGEKRMKDLRSSDRNSYKERSRMFRRRSFTYDDWVRHRSTDRYLHHIKTILSSGIFRGLLKPTLCFVCITLAVSAYLHAHTAGLLPGWLPLLACKMEVFGLTAPALSLLLALRTNTSYRRWLEARRTWGNIIVIARDLTRQAQVIHVKELSARAGERVIRTRRRPPRLCKEQNLPPPPLPLLPLLSLPSRRRTSRTRTSATEWHDGWWPMRGASRAIPARGSRSTTRATSRGS